MDAEIKIRGQLFALHQVVAFLLAREAIRAGKPFNEIHGAFVTQIADACQNLTEDQNVSGQFEAVVSSELDSLFGMAEILRCAMPDK